MRLPMVSVSWCVVLIMISKLAKFGRADNDPNNTTCPSLCLYAEAENTCHVRGKKIQPQQSWKCDSSRMAVDREDADSDTSGIGYKLSNGTKQWICKYYDVRDATGGAELEVVVANETWLLTLLQSQNVTEGCCLVMFYVRWCQFCAAIAADYNALARSYPGLPIIAIDANLYPSVATKYGVVGVPTVLLFYGGRPVMRLNRSQPDLPQFEKFIKYHAGFLPSDHLSRTEEDEIGPVPTKIEESIDIYLYLSSLFLLLSIAVYTLTLPPCASFLQTMWRRVQNEGDVGQ